MFEYLVKFILPLGGYIIISVYGRDAGEAQAHAEGHLIANHIDLWELVEDDASADVCKVEEGSMPEIRVKREAWGPLWKVLYSIPPNITGERL